MNCTHNDPRFPKANGGRWYKSANGSLQCFACFQAEREETRATRRNQLTQILDRGQSVRESWPSGKAIVWEYVFGVIGTYHEDTCSTNRPALINMNAEQLAEHLESREHGFGWTLTALCFQCGDVELLIDLAASVPECDACQLRIRDDEHVFSPDPVDPMYCENCGGSETDHRI